MAWKNNRQRSLYKHEGRNGFIFRDPSNIDVDTDQPVTVDVSMCGHAKLGMDQSESSVNLIGGSDTESVQEIWKRLEVERFLSQLKRELLASGSSKAGNEFDQDMKALSEMLIRDDVYFNYMESQECTGDDQTKTTEAEGVHILTENIGMYKRELEEWDELLDKRKAQVDKAKKGYSEERQLDYRLLQSKDMDALKSFLSAEQLSLLEVEHCGTPNFVTNVSHELDLLNSQLDVELARLGTVGSMKTSKTSSLDVSIMDETPRTLFKALKNMNS